MTIARKTSERPTATIIRCNGTYFEHLGSTRVRIVGFLCADEVKPVGKMKRGASDNGHRGRGTRLETLYFVQFGILPHVRLAMKQMAICYHVSNLNLFRMVVITRQASDEKLEGGRETIDEA